MQQRVSMSQCESEPQSVFARANFARFIVVFVAIAGVLLALAGCSSNKDSNSSSASSAAQSASASSDSAASYGEAKIFAAASLKPVSNDLKKAFETSHKGANLVFNFAGSSDLVNQMAQGAPADVFISADQKNMDKALASKDFKDQSSTVVATNKLVLALPKGNPGNIKSLEDIKGKRVAICAPAVPCGTIAHKVLESHNITLDNPTEEPNVAAVSTKVATGEVDAGFMYSTDVKAQSDKGVTSVAIDGVEPNKYPVALTDAGQDNATAKAFKEWLSTPEAQKILQDYGFSAV